MSACPACHAAVPDGFRFCGECGTALVVAGCRSCGATNPAGQRFCGQCGSSLDGAPVAPAPLALDERKLATVLFADVVGFTSLAERTDPEVVARLVDGAFRRMSEVVAEHGGTVDKYMGDSVMAVFGVPIAHDDDAERAVAAGLAMRELGGDLAFSIGINSGEVMATTVGRAGDVTVIGDAVNVAARLEKVAGPGEVLCGELTAELAGRRVVFRERQPVVLKGKREPVGVWEAVALRPTDVESTGERPPLVGRADELAFLESAWRRARDDRRTWVVVVCGDAGSGKTRLIDELAATAAVEGQVIRAAYPAYGAMGGARVAADIIEQLGPVGDAQVDVRVRSIAGKLDSSLQSIDPAGIEQERQWAFGRLLQQKGAERPLLIVIDDMHRSGGRTLEVLGELAGRVADVPMLLVLAGRTDPSEWLTRFSTATNVRLGPLSRADAAALADAFVCDRRLTPEAAGFLVDRAGGNALYLRELVAMARARGALVVEGDRYGLASHAAIPASLRALLAARLDALEPGHKLVLQHVTVLGDAATAEQIGWLGSVDAASALRSLVDSGLVTRRADGGYDTADPLLGEVAYETLPMNVRGDLHRRAAGRMSRPEDRARHLERAAEYLAEDTALVAQAAESLADAGEAAARASRNLDAIRLLERAVALGWRRPSALLVLANLQSLCDRQEDAVRTLGMVPDDPEDPAVAIERDHIAANTKTFSDPAAAVPDLVAVAARWQSVGNPIKEGWAHANAGVALFNVSRMPEAVVELERGLMLFEQENDRSAAVAASSFLCLVSPADRRVPRWLADALAFADATGDRSKQLNTLVTLAWHHYFRSFCGGPGDMVEAEGFARRLAVLGQELGAPEMTSHGWSLLSVMARFTGRLEEARAHATSAEEPRAGHASRDRWLAWSAGFAVVVAAGTPDAAPPAPPDTATDPVIGVAGLVIRASLTLAGRVGEALAGIDRRTRPELGTIGDLTGVIDALTLVQAGRGADALPLLDRAGRAAFLLGAPAAGIAAAALAAEVNGDTSGLPPRPASGKGLADALVIRAYAAAGDEVAAASLRETAGLLAMPGLLVTGHHGVTR